MVKKNHKEEGVIDASGNEEVGRTSTNTSNNSDSQESQSAS